MVTCSLSDLSISESGMLNYSHNGVVHWFLLFLTVLVWNHIDSCLSPKKRLLSFWWAKTNTSANVLLFSHLMFNFNSICLRKYGISHSSLFSIFLGHLNIWVSFSNQTIKLSYSDIFCDYWHIWIYSSHLVFSFLFTVISSFFFISFHGFY